MTTPNPHEQWGSARHPSTRHRYIVKVDPHGQAEPFPATVALHVLLAEGENRRVLFAAQTTHEAEQVAGGVRSTLDALAMWGYLQ